MCQRSALVPRTLMPLFGIIAIACSAAAQPEPTPVPLVNAGFEEALSGWSVGKFDSLIATDVQTGRTGASSIKIDEPAGTSMPYATQVVHSLNGGATYTFRAWVRGKAAQPHAAAALKIEGYTAGGKNTLGKYARLPLTKCPDWTQIAVTARFPPQITRASLLLRLFGGGTIWFDDVELVQDIPPPAVTLGPERQTARTGQHAVSFVAGLAKPWPNGKPPIRVTMHAPDGSTVSTQQTLTRGTDATVWDVELAIPELAPGTFVVESHLGEELGHTATVFVPMPNRKPTALTETGTILVNGKPFFPVGIYHCSPAHYPMLAKAGFNAVQGRGPQSLEAFGKALDAAAAAGLKMDVPLYAKGKVAENLPASIAGIKRYANHPAVMCWKIIDEPEGRPEIADEVPDVYAQLRNADPNHPIELTLCSPPTFGFWADFCDIMQVDPYPIPRNPLTMVSDWVSGAVAGLKPWQNLTAVLQSGWTQHPFNQPTPEQARCMVYLSLIHGAKGIFWYSFRDPGWALEKTPLWKHFPRINAETLALSEAVMLGTSGAAVSVASPDDTVHWRAWEHKGRTWLLLANPSEEPVTAVVTPGGAVSVRQIDGTVGPSVQGSLELDLPANGAMTRILVR
ncbi:MAG: hypothetical protein HN742_17380 [Lentisphaerae bacterium]|jgi:hypothetical protein|nr:hypothetical protein [Lentisphaerota bacterium]MBT4821735.1 hypothetical protein [Lentisphaerota bacterium]MBT5605674.1 hypothetical protein [Lentisphaerota bacterium]MBT7843654.1 hypothetical protein [Lentisphaerota bacterium]